MEFGYLTLLPPLVAIALAIVTKKVAMSLFTGILLGETILFHGNVFYAVDSSLNMILKVWTDMDNLRTFLFTSLMGSFVILVEASGGVDGFVHYLTEQSKHIRNAKAAMLLAYLIGIIIFIDGLLSIMFTAVVTRPLIDKFKVSREKLAYICDATSAPVNAIIPLNSWGVMLIGLIGAEVSSGTIAGDPMGLLISSLPYQFYSLLSLLFVLFYILSGKDWGPMKKAEIRVQTTGALYDKGVTPLLNDKGIEQIVPKGKGNKWNMLLPLIVLICGTFIGLYVTGHGSLIKGNGTVSILYAVIGSLLLMGIMYSRQHIMSLSQWSDYVMKGVGNMLSLVLLLTLAFAIGRIIKQLGTGPFLASLIGQQVSGTYCAAIVFILGAVMSFATGTSWGTFSIMMPIAIPMAVSMDANVILTIGAVVSSGIFGDHCSPISDTTILSSMSVGTDLLSHVKTQLPYALLTAAIATVFYIFAGFVM